ncbi:hypothetical protein [Streptomyces gardneri]|uniref:hypothetical protein n=1 Tax=Streptomyces gardneri TaxID=66892 RepID=UPI0036778493
MTDQTAATPDQITVTRDQLAALLAHHADVLAARWDAYAPDPAAYALRTHAGELTAEKETPAVAELLDSMLSFRAPAAARQTTGQDDTDEQRYTAEVVQAAQRAHDAEPKCRNCGHLWQHHGDEVCGVLSGHQGAAYYCGCTDAEEDHAPAVGQPAEAHDTDVCSPRIRWAVEHRFPAGTTILPGVNDRAEAEAHLEATRARWPDAAHRLVRETTTWTVEDER